MGRARRSPAHASCKVFLGCGAAPRNYDDDCSACTLIASVAAAVTAGAELHVHVIEELGTAKHLQFNGLHFAACLASVLPMANSAVQLAETAAVMGARTVREPVPASNTRGVLRRRAISTRGGFVQHESEQSLDSVHVDTERA